MKVLLWSFGDNDDDLNWIDCAHIVLWDGENTYWNEAMIPSDGYKMSLEGMQQKHGFLYIGEL